MLRLNKSAEYEPDVRVDDHDASRPMESDAGSKPLLDKITIVGDFESIENDWRHFESYADCTPFQTFDWLATWNRCIGIHASVKPAIVTGRDANGELLFLLPLAIEKVAGCRRLVFLGRDLCDYNMPLLHPDFHKIVSPPQFMSAWREVQITLLQAPHYNYDFVFFDKMLESIGRQPNPLLALSTTLNASGAHVTALDGDWNQFYTAKRSSDTRRRDRTKYRKLSKCGDVSFVTAERKTEKQRILRTLIKQKGRAFQRMGVRNLFDRPGYAEFFREISNNADSLVHVSHVTAGTTIVATNLGLHFRDRYYHILASLTDGEFARFSPGALHLRELMRYAIEAGCNQFDFTIGDESYKSDWADTRLDLYDHVSATNWLGWIATRSLALGLDVKRHIKRSPALWKYVGMLRSAVGSFASRKIAVMRDQDAQSQPNQQHLRTARDDAAISLTRSLKLHPAGITVEAQEILLKRFAGNAGFTTRIEDRPSLQAILPHWHDLAERSAEDNVHYAPNYALALLDSVDVAKHVRFVTVWDENDLMAFLPVVTRVPIPGVTASGSAWATDYTSSCTPLIDRDRFLDASHGLVEGLAKLRRGEWVIPLLNENGIVAKSITNALDNRQAPWAMRAGFQRALLHTGDSFESHMKTHIGSKRRRKLERNRRRLEECGTVSFRTYTSGDDLDGAVEDFLRIEASGWKGKRGTALGCKPDTAEFARRAFGSNGIYAKSRVDLLLLNDEPIAAGVIVFSGDTAFSVKGGYDERYAVWGPGLLLEVEILKSFLTEKWATRLDSATYAPHAIDRLWPDRMSVANLIFSFAPAMAQPRLSAYNHVQDFKSVIKRRAKRILGRN